MLDIETRDETPMRPQGHAEGIGDLLAQRYGASPAALPGEDNAVLRSILGHRSIRDYTGEAIPDEIVALAAAAAASASTSSNMQLWSLVTVREPALKSRLSVLAGDQKHIHDAPLLLVWLADLSRARRAAERENHPAAGLEYLECFVTAAIDAALAAQNAAVALESLGYGTCYIGSMRSHPTDVAAELDLPAEVFPIFGMTVGRPRPGSTAAIKPRLSQQAVVHTERYDATRLDEGMTAYNVVLQTFQASQNIPLIDWSLRLSRRIGSAAALKNRDKLKQYLREMGFPLR